MLPFQECHGFLRGGALRGIMPEMRREHTRLVNCKRTDNYRVNVSPLRREIRNAARAEPRAGHPNGQHTWQHKL